MSKAGPTLVPPWWLDLEGEHTLLGGCKQTFLPLAAGTWQQALGSCLVIEHSGVISPGILT